MSTFTTLKMALTGARSAYNAYADFRDRKMDEAYDTLSSAAENYGPKADDALEMARNRYDDSVKKAGNVTQAARVRLEKALAAAEDKGGDALKDMRSSGKKLNRKGRRKAAKLDKKARKAASGNDSHWVRNIAVAALTASGIAAVVYTVLNKRKQTPGTTPPRVEDQFTAVEEAAVEDEPALVYSTQTGDDAPAEVPADQAADDAAAELEVDAAVDAVADAAEETEPDAEADADVEAAEDLSEAEAIQAEFDAKNAPQREQSDKEK